MICTPIKANKQQLEQVLINFLLNARDAFNDVKTICTKNESRSKQGMKSIDCGEEMVLSRLLTMERYISKIIDQILHHSFQPKKSREQDWGFQ